MNAINNLIEGRGAFPNLSGRRFLARRTMLTLCTASAAAAILSWHPAQAATQTWNGGSSANGDWNTNANWASGNPAGFTSNPGDGADNAVAIFNAPIANTWGNSAANPVVIDSSTEYLKSISFDTDSDSYFLGSIGGNSLFLPSSGEIQLLPTFTTSATETINAPINLALESASSVGYTFANNSAGGTLDFGGGITNSVGISNVLTLTGSNTDANTISGVISTGSASTMSVTKTGTGQWVLSGANTYAGATLIQEGTLGLTFGATTSNIVSSSSALKMGVQSQTVTGSNLFAPNILSIAGTSGTTSQTFNGTTLAYGANHIDITGSGGTTLKLGTLNLFSTTVGAIGITADFSFLSPSTITAATTLGTGLTASSTDNVLMVTGGAPMATVNEDTWATFTSATGAITGLATYPGSVSTGGDIDLTTNASTLTASTTQSLRFNTSTATTLNVGTSSSGLTVDAILMTSAMGANGATIGAVGGANAIKGAGSQRELNIFQYDTSAPLTINAPIDNNGSSGCGLAQAGGGTVIYAGTGSFTNLVFINEGTAIVTGTTGLGSGQIYLCSGATIQVGNGGSAGSLTAGQAIRDDGTLAYDLTTSNTVSSVVTGFGALQQTGSGTTTLTGVNTFSGNTTISAGQLALGSTGSIADSPLITVGTSAGSSAQFNVSAVTGGFSLASGQTLKGGGTVVGALTVGSSSTLSPGNSPGTIFNTGNVTYSTGGSYVWEINNTSGTQGADPGWDTQSITGTLNITATSGSPFTIDINSLTTGDVAGAAANFNKLQNYTWNLATASGGITGFSASDFVLNDAGFANSISGLSQNGSFGITTSGNNLELTYTAAVNTTPTTYSLLATATGGGLANGRLTQGQSTTVTSSITNSGTGSDDTLDYTNLNVSASGGTLSGGTLPKASGGPLAQGASDSGTNTYTAGTPGNITLIPLVGSATNGTIGGAASSSGSTDATVLVDALVENTTQFVDTGFASTSSTAAYRQNYVPNGNLGSVTVTKNGTGAYFPGYDDDINGGAGVQIGTLAINLVGGGGSFAPDPSVALFDFANVTATNDPAGLTNLETDLQNLGYAYVDRFGNTDADLSPATLATFTTASRDYDLEILFSPGPASTPSYVDFDFSNPNYAGIGNVVNIAIVPEPTGLGFAAAIGVAAALFRRRRRAVNA
jgi:fibronectin-binding autotransporter adhesin